MTLTGQQLATVVIRPAQFSLYGDGRAIYTVEHGPGVDTFEMRQARLSAGQIGELLSFALGPAGLANARSNYDNPTVVDALTTTFEVNAGGVDKAVSVYALGAFDYPVPYPEDRAKFMLLSDRLSRFAVAVGAGVYQDLGAYAPEWWNAFISPLKRGQANADWPWPNLDPEAFERQPNGILEHVLTPDRARTVVETGMVYLLDARASDGILYSIRITPLLPDQLGNS